MRPARMAATTGAGTSARASRSAARRESVQSASSSSNMRTCSLVMLVSEPPAGHGEAPSSLQGSGCSSAACAWRCRLRPDSAPAVVCLASSLCDLRRRCLPRPPARAAKRLAFGSLEMCALLT